MRRRRPRVSGAGGPCACRGIRSTIAWLASTRVRSTLPDPARPRMLLIGNPAARPEGLERLLVRGGYHLTEAVAADAGGDPACLQLDPLHRGTHGLANENRKLA